MAIIDQELFVRCGRCGSEVATGIRRTEDGVRERPPGSRRIRRHRCGRVGDYDDRAFYHRMVDADRAATET